MTSLPILPDDVRRELDDLRRVVGDLTRRHADVREVLAVHVRGGDLTFEQHRMRATIERLVEVIGGEPASANDFAECCLVGQTLDDGVFWFGSGVLVSQRVVLTANHLASKGRTPDVVALPTDGDTVPAGVVKRGTFIPKPSTDIAVIVLADDAGVASIALASPADIETATGTTVVGFGSNSIGMSLLNRKRDVELDIKSRTAQEFIAGRSGKGVCKGDSGGPAYIMVDGNRLLAGITRGPELPNGLCGENGRFTRVDAHMAFIEQF
jgi:endonuclease G